MYNFINYQNSYVYGKYYFYQFNAYELPKETNYNNMYNCMNNNNPIKYHTPDKYKNPLIIQSPNYFFYNNYAARTPSPSPIKKSLIKNNNKINLYTHSPDPYLKLYTASNDPQANLRINNINNINNQVMPNINLQQNEFRPKTPEPSLRGRKKLKAKNKINYNIKTSIPLNQSQINNNNYGLNNININYVNTPNLKNGNILPYYNNPNLSRLSTNNYLYQINNNPTITNQINPNTIYKKEYKLERQNKFKQYTANNLEPNDNFNISEFTPIKKIGEGSYGKIFCIRWNNNNKLYAMKKLELHNLEELKEIQNKVKMIKDLYNKTNHYGFIRIFADKVFPLYTFTITYNYYIIMELGERDWEKALQLRMKHQKYYSEYELYQIIFQIVKTLSLMQKNKISHRDIKPQNVLIINGLYKLCDFGEARIIDGNGLIQQRVRGSQLFMSPILFYAYNRNISLVMHNSYKSDVFSLGMCSLLAASLSVYALYDIRELFDINAIANIINNRLKNRYSVNLINLIIKMLQIDENLRMDFIELESFLLNFWRN